jgi:hypothetical protein
MGKAILHESIDLSENEFDSATFVTLYDRQQTSALQVVREILGLRWSNHTSNPANKRLSGYRDSGLWWWYREDSGALTFIVQVGCSCSRDCCGHMCRLRYSLRMIDDRLLILITDQGFNY